MDDQLRTLVDTYGVFLWREAKAAGYTDTAITRAVRAGAWHRVRHGAYTYPDAWTALDQSGRYRLRGRAAYRQARTGVVLSHTSAMIEHGAPLWGVDLTDVHLTRLDGCSGRREAGVRQHRGLLLPGDVEPVDGVRVTTPTRAALELTTVASTESSVVAIDDLLHRGLTSEALLRSRYRSMEAWPHTLATDLVLRLVDGRSESVGESRTRFLCWRFGLPAPVPQLEVLDEHGRIVARLDLAWPEHRAFAEFDGAAKYSTFLRPGESEREVVLREKRRQDRVVELTGWRCIRLTWRDLNRPEHTAQRLSRLLTPDGGVAA